MKTRKFVLSEKEMPEHWYNITASMTNKPLPPLHPGTLQPIGPESLAPLFPMELIKQDVTSEKWVEIPDEVGEEDYVYSDCDYNSTIVLMNIDIIVNL